MSRYIDADKLIKSIPPYRGEYPVMLKAVWAAIDATPTADVVEVVRCKDCKNCNQLYLCKLKGGEAELAYTCRVIDKRVSPNHYCSYGERREENER